MPLPNFPDEHLRPRVAYLYGRPGEYALIVALHPFTLDDQTVETQITFDAFDFPSNDPKALANTTHKYTADDRDDIGLEGSIYLRHAHHPADLTRIAFGPATPDGQGVEAILDFELDFDVEGGGFANRKATLPCPVLCRNPDDLSYRVIGWPPTPTRRVSPRRR